MIRRAWRWLWGSSVRRQLMIGVALLYAVLMTVFVFGLVHRQRAFLLERTKSRVIFQAQLLAASSLHGAMANDMASLSEIIAALAQDSDVIRAMVTDAEGRVIAHTDAGKIGLFRNDPRSLAILRGAPQSTLADEGSHSLEAAFPIVTHGRVVGWAWVARDLRANHAYLAQIIDAGLIYTAVAILLAALVAFLLARIISRQLSLLLAGTTRMAENRLDEPVPVNTENEVGQVTCAFNDAMHRLAEQQEALRESEERWITTLRSIGDAVISTDATGNIVFMNDVAQRLTGWELPEAKGKPLETAFNIVQEVTRIKPENPVAKVIRSGQVVGLTNHSLLIRRDGMEIPVEESGAPIRNHIGKVEGVVLVFRDVSERKKVEAVLRSNERLATTGQLAATIAHEIHNPLDAVGNMLFVIGQAAADDKTRQYASMASGELARVAQITGQMLSFQRNAAKPVPVRIQDVLENTRALWKRKIELAGIQMDVRIDFDGEIIGSPGELRQLFANLVGNAIEALGTGHGKIRIHASSSTDWRSGKAGLRVVVADNGPGIPDEIRSKIFDPFFTTKGESGTGLGLWITADIIRKYDGTMRLRSTTRPGRSGTCFSVLFPLA